MSEPAVAEPAVDPIAAVEAWRSSTSMKVDPVAFGVIQALARRAAAQQGEVRRLLVRRVEALLTEHAASKPPAHHLASVSEHDAVRSSPFALSLSKRFDKLSANGYLHPNSMTSEQPPVRRGALAGLSELVDRLGRAPGSRALALSTAGADAAHPSDDALAKASLSHAAPPRPLKAVTAFKGTWSRLRADQRLRQALAQVPAMSGPLNSAHVVNRALQAMRDLSPEYLDAFISHVDALLWLEQTCGLGELTPRPAMPVENKRRPGMRSGRKA